MSHATSSEMIDIYDCFNKHVGVMPRDEAHAKGIWHRTINFLVVETTTNSLIFQDKKVELDLEDGFFVKTNGGHIQAGETMEESVRELSEELGIERKLEDLIYVGTNQTSVDFGENFLIREFMYYYLVPIDDVHSQIEFKDGEVGRVISVPIKEGLDLLQGKTDEIGVTVHNQSGSKQQNIRRKGLRNFTDDGLYRRIFTVAYNYINGVDRDLLIL